MNDLSIAWTPHPKQALFQSCPVYEVCWGGTKGCGKTDVLLIDFVPQLQLSNARWEKTGRKTKAVALLLRKTFKRLQDIINRSHHVFPLIDPGARWRESDHTWHFPCGHIFEFGHLDDPQAHQNYQGREFPWLGIDQVEEIPYHQYAYLKAQVRSSEEHLPPSTWAVRLTANPLGKYVDWIKRRFKLQGIPAGFEIMTESVELPTGEKLERDRVFIPAKPTDNPSLPKAYLADLLLLPPHMKRAFYDGDWDVTPGSFFGDVFDQNIHVLNAIDSKQLPRNWPVFRAADWGSRSPACCLWITVDNDGNLIVLEELYGPGEDSVRWGKKILEVEEAWGWTEKKTSKIVGFIDPSAFSSHDGPSVVEKMLDLGVGWVPADNERKAGWMEIRRRLQERGGPAGRTPGLRICRNCTNLIRTLPNLTSPEEISDMDGRPLLNNADDIDTKQEDHAADALRYGVMSRPMGHVDNTADEVARWERIAMSQNRINSDRNPTTGY